MFIKLANGDLVAHDHVKRIYIDPDPKVTQLDEKYRLMAQGPATGELDVYDQYVLVHGTLNEIQKAKEVFESQIFAVVEYLPDKKAWRTI